jgi:hypothetical protein
MALENIDTIIYLILALYTLYVVVTMVMLNRSISKKDKGNL